VKRCGKSAPPRQRCRGHGKPHTEQDQIGRNPVHSVGRVEVGTWTYGMGGDVLARCVKPPGRSLEPRSNARPRGMAVPSRLAGTDRIRLTGPAANILDPGPSLCSGFRLQAPASLTPASSPQLTGPAATFRIQVPREAPGDIRRKGPPQVAARSDLNFRCHSCKLSIPVSTQTA